MLQLLRLGVRRYSAIRGAIKFLGETSGMTGDVTGGDSDVGVLGISASTSLNGTQRYKVYKEAMKESSGESRTYGNWLQMWVRTKLGG